MDQLVGRCDGQNQTSHKLRAALDVTLRNPSANNLSEENALAGARSTAQLNKADEIPPPANRLLTASRCTNTDSSRGTSGQNCPSSSWNFTTPAASPSHSAIKNKPASTSAVMREVTNSSSRHMTMPPCSNHRAASTRMSAIFLVSCLVAWRIDGCMLRRTTQVRHSARERRTDWNNDVVEHITIKTATAGRWCLDLLVI
jgi:hypothetical protein